MGIFETLKNKLKYWNVPFPIELVMYRKYRNALKPKTYSALYVKQKLSTEDGYIERRFILYKDGNAIKEIPNFTLPHFDEIEGKQTLQLLEVDLNTFLVVSFVDGVLTADVPIYAQEIVDEQGVAVKGVKLGTNNTALDAKTNQPLTQDEIKERGISGVQQKKDEQGRPVVAGFVKRVVFDTRLMLDEGKIVEIPVATARKTFDRDQWGTLEYATANKLYKTKKWWESDIVRYAVVGFLLVATLYVGLGKLNDAFKITADAYKVGAEQYNVAADKIAQSNNRLAQAIADSRGATLPFATPIPIPPS